MTVAQLVKKFSAFYGHKASLQCSLEAAFYGHKASLQCSLEPDSAPYSEAAEYILTSSHPASLRILSFRLCLGLSSGSLFAWNILLQMMSETKFNKSGNVYSNEVDST
jgi:hypothetical protein